jgi:sulfate adenylyltransferase subunit 1
VTFRPKDDIDISRRDVIVKSHERARVTREIDADLCWFSERSSDHRRKYLIKHTTKTVKALLSRIDYRIDVNTLDRVDGVTELRMNDIARVGFKMQQPLVVDRYARNRVSGSFIVIDEATNGSVAAGMIQ